MRLADMLLVDIVDDSVQPLVLTLSDVASVPRQGDAEQAVTYLASLPYIRRQFEALGAGWARDYLREYGAWDAKELDDTETNRQRVLWLGCLRVQEEMHEIDSPTFTHLTR